MKNKNSLKKIIKNLHFDLKAVIIFALIVFLILVFAPSKAQDQKQKTRPDTLIKVDSLKYLRHRIYKGDTLKTDSLTSMEIKHIRMLKVINKIK
jgi:hypothetical protein